MLQSNNPVRCSLQNIPSDGAQDCQVRCYDQNIPVRCYLQITPPDGAQDYFSQMLQSKYPN